MCILRRGVNPSFTKYTLVRNDMVLFWYTPVRNNNLSFWRETPLKATASWFFMKYNIVFQEFHTFENATDSNPKHPDALPAKRPGDS